MEKQNENPKNQNQTPGVCKKDKVLTFRGSRSMVLTRAWEKFERAEAEGHPLETLPIKDEWKILKTVDIPNAKAKQEACQRTRENVMKAIEAKSKEAEKPSKTEEKAEK